VLTYRFWQRSLDSDPGVVGQTVRLGPRSATIVGVLEPSVPYPADIELFANMVASPHHMGALMVTNRAHRMTELFARLAPGITLEAARAELTTIHGDITRQHPDAYSPRANVQLRVTRLRDQIASPARAVLVGLLAAAGVVFLIACSNVANLILARSVRRQSELAVRAALGAGRGALRRALLAESLVLCGTGAVLGLLLARPLVSIVARYAARFSVRATEVTVDATLLWVGAALAIAAAILLAFVPRLPSAHAPMGGPRIASGTRITSGTSRRLQAFAATQIACSFILLAAAAMLLTALISVQSARTAFDTRQVLAVDIPASATGVADPRAFDRTQEALRRIAQLPGVDGAAAGNIVPWRDAASGFQFRFSVPGRQLADGEENPLTRVRIVTPGFFPVLGVPLLAGRDFNDQDRGDTEPVIIVSQTIAQRFFPNGEAVNGTLSLINPLAASAVPKRIVGVVADMDDEKVVAASSVMTIYQPARQMMAGGGRLFVRAAADPYALVPSVTRIIREIAPEQPVERAATLADVRAEVLTPDRLNAFVFSGFAGIALLIAVVGVAGVLTFSVSARMRDFGVRLAMGSTRARLLTSVLASGVWIGIVGIAAGAVAGYGLGRIAEASFEQVRMPGALPVAVATVVLVAAAVTASLIPAARAARVNVVQALRSE
jgi:predicted permease